MRKTPHVETTDGEPWDGRGCCECGIDFCYRRSLCRGQRRDYQDTPETRRAWADGTNWERAEVVFYLRQLVADSSDMPLSAIASAIEDGRYNGTQHGPSDNEL